MSDYTEARACLLRARAALDKASRTAGRLNLAPQRGVHDIRDEIEAVIALINEGLVAAKEARDACIRDARNGIAIVGKA